ncbi:MAG: YigZ family protein [Lachnospiraceae bacterium]|nr:YigZ family protein [Lachnospiraceae bacterium]
MPDGYRTIKESGNSEVTEKKSRFIGVAAHVSSEDEAADFVRKIKKEYYDARHSCWAYVIGDKSESKRASDDGEPQGTAGRPILDVITGMGLTYTIVVVTRYFGGTLLGTGGLVRAYSKAADEAVRNAVISEMKEADILSVHAAYNDAGRLQYLFAAKGINVTGTEYGADAVFTIMIEKTNTENIKAEMTEATGGRVSAEVIESGFFEFKV